MNDQTQRDTVPELSVVLPAYNEAAAIKLVLEQLRRELPNAQLIVVDDGSTDDTATIARQVDGVEVLSHLTNRGYGTALKTGMRAAQGRLIAWMDADNEHRVDDLHEMLKRFQNPQVFAVLGERSSSTSRVRALGKLLLRVLLWSLQSGRLVRDVNCGFRIFRREAILPYLGLLPHGYSASMTSTMLMIERRHGFEFYPVAMGERHGQSKVRFRHGLESVVLLLRMIMLFAPLRIFLAAGSAAIVLGMTYGTSLAMASGRGFSTLAGVLTLMGVLTIFMGLIADQISQFRLGQLETVDATSSTVVSADQPTADQPTADRAASRATDGTL